MAVTASSPGALIASCHGLILDMVNRGHRVFAFAPELSNNDLRILSHIGAEAYSLPPQLALWDKYRRMRELSTIFGDVDPHVVLVESARNGAESVAAAKIARVPHVVTTVPSLGPAFMEAAGAASWGASPGYEDGLPHHFRLERRRRSFIAITTANTRKRTTFCAANKPQLSVGGWGEDLNRHVQRPLPPLDRGVLFLMATPLDRLQGIVEFCEAAKAMRLKARRARFFLTSTPGEAASAAADRRTPAISGVRAVYRPRRRCGPPHPAMPRHRRAILRQRRPALPVPGAGSRPPDHHDGHAQLPRFCAARAEWLPRGRSRRGIARARHDPDPAKARSHSVMAEESRRQALRFYDMNAVNVVLLEALGL